MDDAKLQIVSTPLSPELPQELDPDFYREALLHIARLTAERLLRERSALADIERRAKIPLGASRSPDAITASERSIAIKESLDHGQRLPWLNENEGMLGFGRRTTDTLLKGANSTSTRRIWNQKKLSK